MRFLLKNYVANNLTPSLTLIFQASLVHVRVYLALHNVIVSDTILHEVQYQRPL